MFPDMAKGALWTPLSSELWDGRLAWIWISVLKMQPRLVKSKAKGHPLRGEAGIRIQAASRTYTLNHCFMWENWGSERQRDLPAITQVKGQSWGLNWASALWLHCRSLLRWHATDIFSLDLWCWKLLLRISSSQSASSPSCTSHSPGTGQLGWLLSVACYPQPPLGEKKCHQLLSVVSRLLHTSFEEQWPGRRKCQLDFLPGA